MMGKILYTAGYGSDPPDVFLKRLKDAGVRMVIDIRKYAAARFGCYVAGTGMGRLIEPKPGSSTMRYTWVPELGKDTKLPLTDYRHIVLDSVLGVRGLRVCRFWIDRESPICLICCENLVFEKGAVTPRCHRYYVANALAKELGDGWEVIHL